MRITRPQLFMEVAHVVAKRSTCFRLNVGAVITHNNSLVSMGYNGSGPGEPHCAGEDCPGRNGCHLTIHAEVNALTRLPSEVEYEPGLDMYVTDSPCPDCCTKIHHIGIKRVFYGKLYRVNDHLSGLRDRGVAVYQVTPAGYVIDHFSRSIVDVR
jgi:dCMP deaminase